MEDGSVYPVWVVGVQKQLCPVLFQLLYIWICEGRKVQGQHVVTQSDSRTVVLAE